MSDVKGLYVEFDPDLSVDHVLVLSNTIHGMNGVSQVDLLNTKLIATNGIDHRDRTIKVSLKSLLNPEFRE